MARQENKGKVRRKPVVLNVAELLTPGVFKALGEPTRIAIMKCLAQSEGARSVGDVAALCSGSISAVSRHLAQLKGAGLLDSARRGKEVYYWARTQSLSELFRQLADAFAVCPADEKKER
jgi:DNA-binding transcriptional ArsR family regulator